MGFATFAGAMLPMTLESNTSTPRSSIFVPDLPETFLQEVQAKGKKSLRQNCGRRPAAVGRESCRRHGCYCDRVPPWQVPRAAPPRMPRTPGRRKVAAVAPLHDVLLQSAPSMPPPRRRSALPGAVGSTSLPPPSGPLAKLFVDEDYGLQELYEKVQPPGHKLRAHSPSMGASIVNQFLSTWNVISEIGFKGAADLASAAPAPRRCALRDSASPMPSAGGTPARATGDSRQSVDPAKRKTKQSCLKFADDDDSLTKLRQDHIAGEADFEIEGRGSKKHISFSQMKDVRRSRTLSLDFDGGDVVANSREGTPDHQERLLAPQRPSQLLQAMQKTPSIGSAAGRESTSSLPAVDEQSTRESVVETASLRLRVFDKVKSLAKNKRIKRQESRSNKWQEVMWQKFNSLPEEETSALQQVFNTFDTDASGLLDGDEIMPCLSELGLTGANSAENREISMSLQHLMDIGEDSVMTVGFLDFALKVVPQVRQRLVELRSNEMLRLFLLFDRQGFGVLHAQQCMEIVRTMGLDQRLFRRIYEEDHGLMTSAAAATLDFEEFQRLVIILKERADRVVRDHERSIKQKTGISDSVFQEFRADIVNLHDLFNKADEDQNGRLSTDEILWVLGEFGLMPRTHKEREEVETLLMDVDVNGDAWIDFCEFLHLTRQIRALQLDKRREKILHVFNKYDRDKNAKLSIDEISALLTDMGVIPKDRKEQEELAVLIQQVDQGSDGYIDFEEFQLLCQRIDERLKSMHFEAEVEYALRLGFSENQLYDLRWAFDSLDSDGSGRLDAHEVRQGLALMERDKDVSQEAFDHAYCALDADGSGDLDFKEYLDFMKLLREGEGLFSEDGSRLPTKVKLIDIRILRRSLEHFSLSKAYIHSLTKHETIDLFCFFMGVKPSDHLHEKLKINSMAEFLDLVRAKGQANSSAEFAR